MVSRIPDYGDEGVGKLRPLNRAYINQKFQKIPIIPAIEVINKIRTI